MALVTCPKCGSQLDVDAVYLGRDVRCGGCQTVFRVDPGPETRDRRDDFDRPYLESERLAPREMSAERLETRAIDRLQIPSIVLSVSGILGIIYFIADTGYRIINFGAPKPQFFGIQQPNPQQMMIAEVFWIIYSIVGIFASILVVVGAGAMRSLEWYSLAMATAILSVIPFPCGGCCCIAPPFGIWALVVLMDPSVKAAFASRQDRTG